MLLDCCGVVSEKLGERLDRVGAGKSRGGRGAGGGSPSVCLLQSTPRPVGTEGAVLHRFSGGAGEAVAEHGQEAFRFPRTRGFCGWPSWRSQTRRAVALKAKPRVCATAGQACGSCKVTRGTRLVVGLAGLDPRCWRRGILRPGTRPDVGQGGAARLPVTRFADSPKTTLARLAIHEGSGTGIPGGPSGGRFAEWFLSFLEADPVRNGGRRAGWATHGVTLFAAASSGAAVELEGDILIRSPFPGLAGRVAGNPQHSNSIPYPAQGLRPSASPRREAGLGGGVSGRAFASATLPPSVSGRGGVPAPGLERPRGRHRGRM